MGEDGRVPGAVISVGGILGLGDKLAGMPWNEVTVHTIGNAVIANLDGDDLSNAPEYRAQGDPRTG